MGWRTASAALIAVTLLSLSVGCGRGEELAREPEGQGEKTDPGRTIAYSGPEEPGDAVWVLRSLNGRDAVGDEDMLVLFAVKGEFGGDGGCMGFSIYHEIEGDQLRLVRPGFQMGSYDCEKPEALERQANDVLDLARNLARLEISDNRLELRSEAGEVAVFSRPPPARIDPALVGTEWVLASLQGEEPLPEPKLTLQIDREGMGGFSGCNSFGGPLDKMVDGSLEWSENATEGFASTAVGCGGAVAPQENTFQDAVAGAESYRLADDRLELRDAGGKTTAALVEKTRLRFDPGSLSNTRWMLRSVDGKRPVEGSVPTLEFGPGREVAWYDGCYSSSGTYAVDEYEITARNQGAVEGDCMKPEAYTNPEGECVRVCFSPDGSYRMRDGLLEIRSEDAGTFSVLGPLPEGRELDPDGTPWELRAFVEDGRTDPVIGDERLTLAFDRGTLRDEGTMSGSTGCNDYRVAYEYPVTRNGLDRLILEEPSVTRRACAGPRYATEQERRFLGILRDVGYYPDIVARPGSLADARMSLDTEDGRALVFAPPE